MRAILLALIFLVLPVAASALTPSVPQGNVLSEGEVRRVISDYLLKKTQSLGAQVSIKKIGYSGSMVLPAGRVSFEVLAPERWEGYGNTSLALIVRVDDQVKRNLSVLVEVEALVEMVVATRSLERGEVLEASDLTLALRDLAHTQGRFLRFLDEATGLRVKIGVRANSPLRTDYLERVPLIKSGQMVIIVVENESVKITATGRAKGSGALGDTIMVQNLSSLKDLAARVVDANTVKVDF
jgi:flagella basal body P-ring formation protein FlgA